MILKPAHTGITRRYTHPYRRTLCRLIIYVTRSLSATLNIYIRTRLTTRWKGMFYGSPARLHSYTTSWLQILIAISNKQTSKPSRNLPNPYINNSGADQFKAMLNAMSILSLITTSSPTLHVPKYLSIKNFAKNPEKAFILKEKKRLLCLFAYES